MRNLVLEDESLGVGELGSWGVWELGVGEMGDGRLGIL